MIYQLIGGTVLYCKKAKDVVGAYVMAAKDTLLLSAQPDAQGNQQIRMIKMTDTPFAPVSVEIPITAILMMTVVSDTAQLDAALGGIVLAKEMPKIQ